MELRDFRPISRAGCVYKLLAKVLADRLKVVLPLIIGHFQEAFVQGKRILDGTLIANDLRDSRTKSKDLGVFFKIDMEKALEF